MLLNVSAAFLSLFAVSFDGPPAFALVDAVATEGAHARACPSRDIERFVSAFAEDVSLQKLFTAAIVETAFVDHAAEPEPAEIVRPIQRGRLRFPLMPNRAQQNQEGLSYRLVSIDAVRAIIALSAQDTDSQLVYMFRRDRCWTLMKISVPAFGKPR